MTNDIFMHRCYDFNHSIAKMTYNKDHIPHAEYHKCVTNAMEDYHHTALAHRTFDYVQAMLSEEQHAQYTESV